MTGTATCPHGHRVSLEDFQRGRCKHGSFVKRFIKRVTGNLEDEPLDPWTDGVSGIEVPDLHDKPEEG